MDWIHKITRPTIDDDALFGFVLKTSKQLALVAEESDFCMDGYRIMRNADMEICKATPSTRYCTRLMKKEGICSDPAVASLVDISDWRRLLIDLRKLHEFVIIEDEDNEEFLIGPIQRVNKKSVTIKYFDGTGKWLGPRNITYDCITRVTFRCRYINVHRKYIKDA